MLRNQSPILQSVQPLNLGSDWLRLSVPIFRCGYPESGRLRRIVWPGIGDNPFFFAIQIETSRRTKKFKE